MSPAPDPRNDVNLDAAQDGLMVYFMCMHMYGQRAILRFGIDSLSGEGRGGGKNGVDLGLVCVNACGLIDTWGQDLLAFLAQREDKGSLLEKVMWVV